MLESSENPDNVNPELAKILESMNNFYLKIPSEWGPSLHGNLFYRPKPETEGFGEFYEIDKNMYLMGYSQAPTEAEIEEPVKRNHSERYANSTKGQFYDDIKLAAQKAGVNLLALQEGFANEVYLEGAKSRRLAIYYANDIRAIYDQMLDLGYTEVDLLT